MLVSITTATRREPWSKRWFDVLLSSVGLLFSAPLWPLVALAIKLEDGGPVFYVHQRWGKGGRVIRVRKFRSMVVSADVRFGATQARESDPRVTRVGKLLRQTGLDELPQLLSIWIGDMSLVGPRALAIDEQYVARDGSRLSYTNVEGFTERLAVRPGLTGLATIYLAKDAAPRDRFALDIEYVNRQSLMLDLRLVALSLWISFRGRWEDRATKL
jgi:polysaccharide biosynthesis protein PslA